MKRVMRLMNNSSSRCQGPVANSCQDALLMTKKRLGLEQSEKRGRKRNESNGFWLLQAPMTASDKAKLYPQWR